MIDEKKYSEKYSELIKLMKDGRKIHIDNDGKLLVWGDGDVGLSEQDKHNKELAIFFMKINPSALGFFASEIINDKELLMKAVSFDSYNLRFANEELRNDKEFGLIAAKNNDVINPFSSSFEYVGDKLKNDDEFIREAIRINPGAVLPYIKDSKVANDKEFILKVFDDYHYIFEYLSDKLKNDKDVVLKAIEFNPETFKDAGKTMKNDKEVVLRAIRKDPMLLEYVSDDLKNDKNIVLEAVSRNPNSYEFASEELRNDIEIAIEAVSGEPDMLKFAPKTEEVVLEAVKANPKILDGKWLSVETEYYAYCDAYYDCTELYGVSKEMKEKVMKKYNKLVKKGKIVPVSEKQEHIDVDFKVEPDIDVSYEVDDENAKEEDIDVEYNVSEDDAPEKEDNITFERS